MADTEIANKLAALGQPLTMSQFLTLDDLCGAALRGRREAVELAETLEFERTALRAERDELLGAARNVLVHQYAALSALEHRPETRASLEGSFLQLIAAIAKATGSQA